MSEIFIKITDKNGKDTVEEINSYLNRLSKKNNSVLYHIEEYLEKSLFNEPKLLIIRNTILDVSGDIARLSTRIVGDSDE